MNRNGGMPFGADLKDPLWRWGSFLVGVPSLVVLVWIATLGDVSLWNSWWWMWLVLGILMSLRSGRAWYRGDLAVRAATKEMVPAVEVKGQPGSTYVVLDRPRMSTRTKVKPDEFGPLAWAVYSLFVRFPVAAGDVVLTLIWRAFGSVGLNASNPLRSFQMDRIDRGDDMPPPDRDTF